MDWHFFFETKAEEYEDGEENKNRCLSKGPKKIRTQKTREKKTTKTMSKIIKIGYNEFYNFYFYLF